jgi:hypothetical protein
MNRIASTTDDQQALNNAAAGRVSRQQEPDWIYTEVGPSIQSADGSLEHSEPFVRTNLRTPKPSPDDFRGMVTHVSAEADRNFQIQLAAARSTIPDFEEVTKAEGQLQIPVAAAVVMKADLHNGAAVAYFLSKHPAEVERLQGLSPRAQQSRMYELSAEIATNEAAGLDKASYRDFARVRNRQSRENYRG